MKLPRLIVYSLIAGLVWLNVRERAHSGHFEWVRTLAPNHEVEVALTSEPKYVVVYVECTGRGFPMTYEARLGDERVLWRPEALTVDILSAILVVLMALSVTGAVSRRSKTRGMN